jgi:Holliday junction resolvase-like predicted endonuclease
MKNKSKKKIKNIHSTLIDELEKKVRDNCVGVVSIEKNVEYALGEVDLLVKYVDGKQIYFEIKSNYSFKSYDCASDQLQRWTLFKKCMNKTGEYIGVYVSQQYRKPLYRDGKFLR